MASKETDSFKLALDELISGNIISQEELALTCSGQTEIDLMAYPAPTASVAPAHSPETVIATDVVIEGNITCASPVKILGQVTGNVNSSGNIVVEGKVGGQLKGSNIFLNGCSVNSNIIAGNEVNISEQAKVCGDIQAGVAVTAGHITGNLVAKSVSLLATACMQGDIQCTKIKIADGASLRGRIETATE